MAHFIRGDRGAWRFNLAGNRYASQPINAILPYAYAARQSQAPIEVVAGAASELRRFDCDAFGPHAEALSE